MASIAHRVWYVRAIFEHLLCLIEIDRKRSPLLLCLVHLFPSSTSPKFSLGICSPLNSPDDYHTFPSSELYPHHSLEPTGYIYTYPNWSLSWQSNHASNMDWRSQRLKCHSHWDNQGRSTQSLRYPDCIVSKSSNPSQSIKAQILELSPTYFEKQTVANITTRSGLSLEKRGISVNPAAPMYTFQFELTISLGMATKLWNLRWRSRTSCDRSRRPWSLCYVWEFRYAATKLC